MFAFLLGLGHLLAGILTELARRHFDLPTTAQWAWATIGNLPVWFAALLIGGAYAIAPSVRTRWLVWLFSLMVMLYVVIELPAARYFGLHLSWPMLVQGWSSFRLSTPVIAEIDPWTLRLLLFTIGFHFLLAYQIRGPVGEAMTRRRRGGLLVALGVVMVLWIGFAKRLPDYPPVALAFSSAGAAAAGAPALRKNLFSLRYGHHDETSAIRSALADSGNFFLGQGVRPNVVFVVIETVAARQLLQGGRIDPLAAPQLARLQERGGVLFDQVVVNHPDRLRSQVAMATSGRYPTWLDPAAFVTRRWGGAFAVDAFRAANYRTGFFATVDLGELGLGRFLAQGAYDQLVHAGTSPAAHDRQRAAPATAGDEPVLQRASAWLGRHGDAPFFLQLLIGESAATNLASPGATAPAAVPPSGIAARTRQQIAAADAAIGHLTAELAARRLLENTLVVVTGDHGLANEEPADAVERGGGFDDSIREFALFSLPNGRPIRSGRVIANGDLLPTAAAIAGIAPAAGEAADPTRTRNALAANWAPRLQFFHHDRNPGGWGLRDGEWKFISQASGGSKLFNLASDPDEKNNLIAQYRHRNRVYDQLAVAWFLERNADFSAALAEPDFLPQLDADALSRFGLKQLISGFVEPAGDGYRVVPAQSFNPAEPIHLAALWVGFPVPMTVDYVWTDPDGVDLVRRKALGEGFLVHRLAMPGGQTRGAEMKAGAWRLAVRVNGQPLVDQSFVIDPATPRRFTGDPSRFDTLRARLIRLEVGALAPGNSGGKRLRPTDAFFVRSTWRGGLYDESLEYQLISPQGKMMPMTKVLSAGATEDWEEVTPPVALWSGNWKVRLLRDDELLAETGFAVGP